MEQSVKNKLDELHQKKEELESTRNEIVRLHNLYREETKKEETLESDISKLKRDTIFQVRLGDIIEELSTLADIPAEEIDVKLFFDCWHKKDQSSDVESTKSWIHIMLPGVVFHITAPNGQFEFFGTSKNYDKSESPILQADGASLLEHSSFQFETSPYFGDDMIAPVIDRNTNDIILKIDLNLLERSEDINWHPKELFVEAITNCIEKTKGYQKVKKDETQQ